MATPAKPNPNGPKKREAEEAATKKVRKAPEKSADEDGGTQSGPNPPVDALVDDEGRAD
jgi:hypothetical protein